jgi:hypothetical protein
MKFTSTKTDRDPSEAKAFLDSDGDLVVLGNGNAVCLTTDGFSLPYTPSDLASIEGPRTYLFEGDTIQITF